MPVFRLPHPISMLVVAVATIAACSDEVPAYYGAFAGSGQGGYPSAPTGPPSDAERALMQLLQQTYPNGTAASGGMLDESVELTSQSGAGVDNALERVPVDEDDTVITIGAGWSSNGAPVDRICVGFGSPDDLWCIPIDSPGVSATGDGGVGAASINLPFPAALCADLSQICHDIRCYESAQTSAGTFSAANINLLAMACGGCSEPSCQSLLPPGTCGGATCTPACASNQICVDGVCELATASNSCAQRTPMCCAGQDDFCTSDDGFCLCDAFCIEAGDCCADACTTCGFCN